MGIQTADETFFFQSAQNGSIVFLIPSKGLGEV
jgi:hypothetical protein